MSGASDNWTELTSDHASAKKRDRRAVCGVCEDCGSVCVLEQSHSVLYNSTDGELGQETGCVLRCVPAGAAGGRAGVRRGGPQVHQHRLRRGADDRDATGRQTHQAAGGGSVDDGVVGDDGHARRGEGNLDSAGRGAKRYDAVRETALASVRAWLKMPSFKGRRRREETGRRDAAQPTYEPRPAQYDMVGLWLQRLAECE
jgi:hypothetical protein